MIRIFLATLFLALVGCATNQPVEPVESSDAHRSEALFIDEKTEMMDAPINMQMDDRLTVDSFMRLMGDFLGYTELRPDPLVPAFQHKINLNYSNTPWVTILREVCEKEALLCWIEDETLYFVTPNMRLSVSLNVSESSAL